MTITPTQSFPFDFFACVNFVIELDQHEASRHKTRKFDNITPYAVHPLWCMTTILAEPLLPQHLRYKGAQALLFHDVIEDTNVSLPSELNDYVVSLIQDMTFESSAEEMAKIWEKPRFVQLLKLYDKTSNFMDGTWMSFEKREIYKVYIRLLIDNLSDEYEDLNIFKIARSIL